MNQEEKILNELSNLNRLCFIILIIIVLMFFFILLTFGYTGMLLEAW